MTACASLKSFFDVSVFRRGKGGPLLKGDGARRAAPGVDGVTVETDRGTFAARIVVGADGSNGITRRSVLPDAPVHTARVLEVITPTLPEPRTTQIPP